MSDKTTGGPAFPEHIAVTEVGDTYSGEPGMTLRDYFAAKALPGMMGRDWSHMTGRDSEILQTWVTMSYRIADMMLAERAAAAIGEGL